MQFIFHNSQYKYECDREQQQREESHQYSKGSDRHNDNSLLGSVRRRFIAPKLRVQHSHGDSTKASPTNQALLATPSTQTTNEMRSKTRSMTMDLRRSVSRESINTNGHGNGSNGGGRMAAFFSSSKVN
jgi:hypothetical protein